MAEDNSRKTVFGAELSSPTSLFAQNQHNAKNYRIPSLITTKDNMVIAAIDKRHKHSADWGNIDTVIRRSTDGGKTWSDDQVVIDLAEQPNYTNEDSAFLIDPLMVQDKNTGRIFMMVDMFPETRGFFGINQNHSSEGTGYKNIDGKSYRLLTNAQGSQYTVRENGIVFDENNQATNYRVVVQGDASNAFRNLGDLYEGETRVGNIFLQATGTNKDTAPLKVQITSYLWMTYSDDNGATWSNPVDLTPQVKADWMRFLGVGPGNGIQLKNGNLIMPVYYTNSNNKQSSAVLISKDGGQTWERSESPNDRFLASSGGSRYLNSGNYEITESQVIELNNSELKMFSRNTNGSVQISTSKNGGYTWLPDRQFDEVLADPYSQMSVIKYSKLINGKEYVLFANPHSATRSRVNGKVWLGEVQDDGSIDWKYNTTISTGSYAYNSLTELPNGDIGLLYEESAEKIQFVSLNLQELLWRDNIIHNDIRKDAREFSLNGEENEVFYKIGDGEMIKVGEGINPAHLVIQEGGFTLNQQADSKGEKRAFRTVIVEPNGTARLGTADQIPLNRLFLNNGTLDLNGNTVTVDQVDQLKTLSEHPSANHIYGNIVNDNTTAQATFTYTIDGTDKFIVGNIGNDQGNLNLIYQPNTTNSNLAIQGNTILNVVDVKSGTVTYLADTQHQAKQLKVGENSTFAVANNTTTTIGQTELNHTTKSQIYLVSDKGGTTQFTTNSTGSGNIVKKGVGLLKLSGNLSHNGTTLIETGSVEFNGNLTNSHLTVNSNATLGGTANISGDSTWKPNSKIHLGFNQPSGNFGVQVMKFANVINEGATVLLRVNNIDENISSWAHDELLVNGKLQSENPVPVNVHLLGNHQGNSDTNNNGKYDVDEGISLIQVAGENNKLQQFSLNSILTNARSAVFQYALVNVDKSVTNKANSRLTDRSADFYDYRLQTLLVDTNGNNPNPVIRSIDSTGMPIENDEKPTVSDLEIANILLAEKQKELEQANADKVAAQKAAEQANSDKAAADKAAEQANADKAAAEKATEQANADKAAAEKAAEQANADKSAAQKAAKQANADKSAAQKAAEQANADKAAAQKAAEQANADKAAAQKAAEQANTDKAAAEKATEQANAEKAAAQKAAEQANADKAAAQKAAEQANADKAAAEKAAEQANADKAAAEKSAEQANADKAAAQKATEQANADKTKSDLAKQQAEAELARLQAEKAAAEAKKQQEMEQAAKQYRAAVHQKVPSYLVANNAMLNQGDNIRRQFMDNIWSDDKKGFYVNQQNGNAKYSSNLGFNQYGYGYKANQSSTLFGGFAPINDHTELHAAVGFGKQTVTPQAVDGSSETRYKSTSFLVGLHNKWDNVIFNTVLGYHLHRGKVSTAEQKNISRVEGTQVQVAGELGYEIPVGQFAVTPMVGVSYQHLRANVEDNDRWNVSLKPYNVFSQQVGSNFSWKNDIVRVSAGAFYEHNNGQPKAVNVAANGQHADFSTGRQGNALLLKLNSDFTLAKQFTFGLRLEHRHGLSSAKLKQTQFGGKLEYKF